MRNFRIACVIAAGFAVVLLSTAGVSSATPGRTSDVIKSSPRTTIVGSEILPGEPGYVPIPPDVPTACLAIYGIPCPVGSPGPTETTIPADDPPRDLPLTCVPGQPVAAIYPSPCSTPPMGAVYGALAKGYVGVHKP